MTTSPSTAASIPGQAVPLTAFNVIFQLRSLTTRVIPAYVILAVLLASTECAAETKTLLFVGNDSYPPVSYQEGGKPKGLAIDIVREIAQRKGWQIDIRLMEWKTAQAMVAEGTADVLPQLSITEPRKQIYDFSDQAHELRFSIFVRTGKQGIDDLSDLQGLRVAAINESVQHKLAKSVPQINFTLTSNDIQSFQLLKDGKVDAVLADLWTGSYVLVQHGFTGIQTSGEPFAHLDSAIAVKKGNTELLAAINDGLRSLKADGTIERINAKWRPQEIVFQTRQQALRKTYSILIGILCLLLAGGAFWLITLRREISERKRSEEEMQKSRAMLARTESIAHIGSWELDVATGAVTWSDELFRITQLNPADGAPSVEDQARIYNSEDMKELVRVIGIAVSDGIPYEIESRIIRPNGEMRTCLARGFAERGTDGKVTRLFGSFQDITERKRIEEVQSYLLQVSSHSPDEDFFESLARYLADTLGMDYVCIDTLHGDSLSARTLAIYNDGRFEDNIEYTLKDTPCGDVVGKEVCVFPREVRNLFPQDASLQDLQAESYVGTTLWSFDMKPIGLIAVVGRKELNSSHFAETVLKLVAIRAAGELERRKAEDEKALLEQQFQQTQKLESLGVLAGGIAHDFNNILAIIIGYCGLTKMDYETAENNIQEIEKAAERAAGLCRQMLAYAGKAQLTMSQVNMGMLLDEMVTMLKATLPPNAGINLDVSTDIPLIKADSSQIRQIIMNLIINASEAIGNDHGEIRVSVAPTAIIHGQSEPDYNGTTITPGEYVCLEVTDNGCGMDEETKWRIFEPFYTTKFTGRGLGMSAVLGIIKSHGGALQLVSELGKGTTFKVYLPVPKKYSSEDEHQKQSMSSAPWQGSGTILLVEDEEQVRLIAKALLKHFGFTVLEAVNGKEALELYQRNATDIILVITDMGMPVMDGYELFSELKKITPQLPIIVSSGYGDAEVSSRFSRDDIAGIISKPYGTDQLREVLKKALEAAW